MHRLVQRRSARKRSFDSESSGSAR